MRDLIFITGFEPFGGSDRNFSAELVARLAVEPKLISPEIDLATAILPTIYTGAVEAALAHFQKLPRKPAMMISFGEANRPLISLETAAWNRDDAKKADNAGITRSGEPIDPQGPARRGFRFPVQVMHGEEGTELSISPGYFICNHIAYVLAEKLDVPFTFIHVPATNYAPDLERHAEKIGRLIASAWEFQRAKKATPFPHVSNPNRLPATRAEAEAMLAKPALGAAEQDFLRQLLAIYDKAKP